MNELPHFVVPPLGSPSRVEPWAKGYKITVRNDNIIPTKDAIVLVVVLIPTVFLGGAFLDDLLRSGSNPSGSSIARGNACNNPLLLFFCLCIVFVKGRLLFKKSLSATVLVSGEQLVVLAPGDQTHRWDRDALAAIAAWKGLQIAERSGKNTGLFLEWDMNELTWLAEVLRRVLQVPEEQPPGPGELAVAFSGTFWDEPTAGLLRVEQATLTLRHPFDREPFLSFRLGTGVRSWIAPNAVPLAETDIICRREEDGSACLRIAPTGATCYFRSTGQPEVRFSLGPFLHESVALEAGTSPKRRTMAHGQDFQMTIRCADNEALPRALAQFWGNEERD
jgi:hypothetical protein